MANEALLAKAEMFADRLDYMEMGESAEYVRCLAAALREAREKQKQLEARVAELEEDGCWLSERCATCGHRFAHAADHCPQCGVKVGPNEPDVYPELCECRRCIVARNVAMDAAMNPTGGEGSGHE